MISSRRRKRETTIVRKHRVSLDEPTPPVEATLPEKTVEVGIEPNEVPPAGVYAITAALWRQKNTRKTYAKLGVRGRPGAVARAQELGLLK